MENDITKALEVLKKGGTIIYPTDTIWGIGCDATNEEAVEKTYLLKQRPDTKSMLVLIAEFSALTKYVESVPQAASKIIAESKKPVTIIYPAAKNIAQNLISSDGTIGIRITKDEFCSELIRRFKKPIVSTSANISGEPHPANFSYISQLLLQQADYVVEWRSKEQSKPAPSRIVKITESGEVIIIRD